MAKYYTDPTTGQRVEIKKTHKFRNFVVLPSLGLVALIVIIASATSGNSAPTGNGPAATVAPTATSGNGHTVRYEVSGDGQGMVTFTTDQNMSMSQSTQSLPWSTDLQFPKTFFAPLSINVTRSYDGGSGPLGCKIIVDGKVVTENHSTGGQFSTVMCNSHI